MTNQLAYTLAAAAVGFVAAVLFCVGNAMNRPATILDLARPRWDFHEPLARSIAAQRSQYVIGALFLVVAFALQLAAALAPASSTNLSPGWLNAWPAFLAVVLLFAGVVAVALVVVMYKVTVRKVLALAASQQ